MADTELEPAPFDRRQLVGMLLRFIAALGLVLVTVAALSYVAREQSESLARGFVQRFGYGGMALGTLLADGLHFPVPPQFYMLLAIASGASIPLSFAAIAIASLAAGFVGFWLSSYLSRWSWVEKLTRRPRQLFEQAVQRFGYRAALVASLLPIPYSVLCYLVGLNRLSPRFLLLLGLLRIPKLMGFYYLVYLGWRGL